MNSLQNEILKSLPFGTKMEVSWKKRQNHLTLGEAISISNRNSSYGNPFKRIPVFFSVCCSLLCFCRQVEKLSRILVLIKTRWLQNSLRILIGKVNGVTYQYLLLPRRRCFVQQRNYIIDYIMSTYSSCSNSRQGMQNKKVHLLLSIGIQIRFLKLFCHLFLFVL